MEQVMPLLFVGHGNPMNVLLDNTYTKEWERIGSTLVPPKAIVCMSAHWLTTGSFITSSLKPELIYDFYGFPEELYHISYTPPGSIKVAENVHETCPEIALDTQWGIDHGAWSVLKRMFPRATIPVLQLSIDYSRPPETQYELMCSIKDLRKKGIMFIGSGNIVHNLGMAAPHHKPFDWALEFESLSKKLIGTGDVEPLFHYEKLGPAAKLSIPTNDHYRPMLNTIALKYEWETPLFFNEGIDMASVSMLSFIYK